MSFGKNSSWSEDAERQMAKQLKGFLPPEVFGEGFRLFQGGHVTEFAWDNNTKFSGKIDGGACSGSVDFGFLPFSRCSCKPKGSCSHLAALICMALFSRDIPLFPFVRKYMLGNQMKEDGDGTLNPATLLANAQTAASVEIGIEELPVVPLRELGPDPQEFESGLPAPWDGYRKWHRLFEKRMPVYKLEARHYFKWVEHHLLNISKNWNDETPKALYRAHALLYAFRLADRSFSGFGVADAGRPEMLNTLVSKLVDSLNALAPLLARDGNGGLGGSMEGLTSILHDLAFEEQYTLTNWMDIYRGVWSRLPVSSAAIRREMNWLRQQSDGSPFSYRSSKMIAGIVHMHELEAGPEAATTYLLDHWKGSPLLFFSYLTAYHRSGNWRYLEIWLKALRDIAALYGNEDDVEVLLEFWEPYANATLPREKRAEELGRFLEKLLPTGFHAYAAVLLGQEDYRGWVDLHLAYGEIPNETDGFEIVKRKAPELLLPVYHLFAEEWIGERKREGYRHAIVHLKILKDLYEKIKRPDRWSDYANKLIIRHSRLKALHEEMRKGRLLPK